jgi:tripartite-type tricarboxylate transporter receptor subunit TctC
MVAIRSPGQVHKRSKRATIGALLFDRAAFELRRQDWGLARTCGAEGRLAVILMLHNRPEGDRLCRSHHTLMADRCVLLVAAVATALTANNATAQAYPTRPIRIIVPYAAAGGSDITTRIVQARASELLGQPLVVDNRPGGATLIGTRAVANATPDGYTLGVMDPAFIVNPTLMSDARYDPLKDFVAVTLFTVTPLMLVVPPSFSARSVQALVEFAKANPAKLNFGSPGDGSAGHIAMEQFRSFFGLQVVHVPYKGAGPAVAAVVGNEVPALFAGSGATPFVQDGRLRALAVTSTKRLTTLPAVQTFSELGFPQVNVQTFAGLVAPAGTPNIAIRRLHSAFAGAVQTPEVKAKLEQFSQIPVGSTPQEFAAFLQENGTRLVKVLQDSNIKIDPR